MSETRPPVTGIGLDCQNRCAHYSSALDIISIKMRCCGIYYACKDCHEALAGHPAEVWPPDEWDQPAVLCGACGKEITTAEYFACANECPGCHARFNPGCRNHYHFYFAKERDQAV